jgi:hypothetical protein
MAFVNSAFNNVGISITTRNNTATSTLIEILTMEAFIVKMTMLTERTQRLVIKHHRLKSRLVIT